MNGKGRANPAPTTKNLRRVAGPVGTCILSPQVALITRSDGLAARGTAGPPAAWREVDAVTAVTGRSRVVIDLDAIRRRDAEISGCLAYLWLRQHGFVSSDTLTTLGIDAETVDRWLRRQRRAR